MTETRQGGASAPAAERRRAFTLIELLAVIAILLVLLSIFGPVLMDVQQRSSLVPCANNLRQIYNLCLTFGADHDGDLPASNSANPATFRYEYATYKELEKYMASCGTPPSIWYCPSSDPNQIAPWMWGRTDTPQNVFKEFRIGYFYTCNTDTLSLRKYEQAPPRTLAEMLNTTNTIIFDIIRAPRPSPESGADVTYWSYFPHYGVLRPGVCQLIRGDGANIRRPVADIRLRYHYDAPTECYW
jgi:prepilin-type N-terminal cleavage/methylation domain-containing protein